MPDAVLPTGIRSTLKLLFEAHCAEVKNVSHRVAGRMTGHMTVLLAQSNVPYNQLAEPQDINPSMDTIDVAIVIGANEGFNAHAREEPSSSLYGMPIINAHHARSVLVLKRSLSPDFAGVENPVFFMPNARMLFGDAKTTIAALLAEFEVAKGV